MQCHMHLDIDLYAYRHRLTELPVILLFVQLLQFFSFLLDIMLTPKTCETLYASTTFWKVGITP